MMKKSEKAKRIVAVLMSMCVFCAVPAVVSGCGGDESGQHQTDPVKVKDGIALDLKTGESTAIKVSDYITANGNAVTADAGNSGIVTATLSDGVVTVTAVAEGTGKLTLKCKGVEIVFNVAVTKKQLTAPVFGDKKLSLDLSEKNSVTLTLSPDENDGFEITGYENASPLIGNVSISGNELNFTPADTGSYEIKIKASYTKDGAAGEVTFTVTVNVTRSQIIYYTVTVDGVEQPRKYAAGSTFTLPAYEGNVPDNKQFAGWTVNGGAVTSAGSAITVNADLTIMPHFTDISQTAPVKVKDGEAKSLYLADNGLTFSVSSYITVNGNVATVASQNSEVVTASLAGDTITVTAHKAGKADLTLTCKDITLTFPVTVKNAAPTFTDGTMEIDLYEENKTGTYRITPNGADTFTYAYGVDNGATVTNDGVVSYTALSGATAGTVNLTVSVTATDSATDAQETATFNVVVTVIDTTSNRLINGGFETGDLAGWTHSGGDSISMEGAVISAETYWGEGIPYNQSGNYHFDGWAATNIEANTYSLKSSVFTLGGSGFISFKMGGRTSVLKVYKANGEQIAEYNNTAYSVGTFPHVDEGCRQGTMTTFLADLSAYKNEQLYVEICDEGTSDWGVAFFDEIVTYYKVAPVLSQMSDKVHLNDKTAKDEQEYDYYIPWVEAVNIKN